MAKEKTGPSFVERMRALREKTMSSVKSARPAPAKSALARTVKPTKAVAAQAASRSAAAKKAWKTRRSG